jgi:hypothetical protein
MGPACVCVAEVNGWAGAGAIAQWGGRMEYQEDVLRSAISLVVGLANSLPGWELQSVVQHGHDGKNRSMSNWNPVKCFEPEVSRQEL